MCPEDNELTETDETTEERLFTLEEVNAIISARLSRRTSKDEEPESDPEFRYEGIFKELPKAILRNLEQGFDAEYLNALVYLDKYLSGTD
jgi:hypothetical protein